MTSLPDLPPEAHIGDGGHVDGHNGLRKSILALNSGKAEADAVTGKADRSYVDTELAKKAPTASPKFTGTVELPAVKVTQTTRDGWLFTSDSAGNGRWLEPANISGSNRLTNDQAFCEKTVGEWDTGNCTVKRSTTTLLDGDATVEVSLSTFGTATVLTTVASAISVMPGGTYTFCASARTLDARASGRAAILVRWLDADNKTVKESRTPAVNLATKWESAVVTGVAPAGAVKVQSGVELTNATSNPGAAFFHLGHFGHWSGAGGSWARPGAPVSAAGNRFTTDNGERIWLWDSTTTSWRLVQYDSGWIDIKSKLYTESGWTIPWARIRRQGDSITAELQVEGPIKADVNNLVARSVIGNLGMVGYTPRQGTMPTGTCTVPASGAVGFVTWAAAVTSDNATGIQIRSMSDNATSNFAICRIQWSTDDAYPPEANPV